MRRVLLAVAFAACAESTSANPDDIDFELDEAGKGDGSCPVMPANIAPALLPTYSCAPLDVVNTTIMADVNRFWSSQVVACKCGPDFPQGCVGAWSLFGTGYVWIGQDFINSLSASGSLMPAQYVFAHEFGHEIQGRFNGWQPFEQQRELVADCLAGYYLGSLACRNAIRIEDIIATLATACIIADGTGNPLTDLNTHGTCEQRASAVAAGMKAYADRKQPLQACSLGTW